MATQTRTRGYSLRFTIATLLVGLLILAVGGALLIALMVRNRSIEATSTTLLGQVGEGFQQTMTGRLRPAEGVLRAAVDDARDGLLLVGDTEAWSRQLASRIRYSEALEWMGFIEPKGRGAAAIRQPDGRLLLLHTEPAEGTESVETVFRVVDGVADPVVTRREAGDLSKYQDVPWYALGAENREPVWTARHIRRMDGQPARACAVGLRDGDRLRGVFGAGFGLAFISEYIRGLRPGKTGRVFVIRTDNGEVSLGPEPEAMARLRPVVETAFSRVPNGVSGLEAGGMVVERVPHDGETYVVGLRHQHLSESMRWINAIVVPEDDLVGYLGRFLRWGLLGVIGLLLGAAILALALSHRIAAPLRDVAAELRRVGAFELDAPPIAATRIREVSTVGEEVERMKSSLRSFSHYVPTDLVRQLVKEGGEATLGGEMRELTLFFSDVKGFTSVSEGMAVPVLVEALGEYLDEVVRALGRQGGTVDKFMGDGVLAFFNAPIAAPMHAADSCRAALGVQAALAARRTDWASRDRPDFATRIGLHTGEVLVGNIGTPERFGYTVLGDAVNLAARLESLNKAYGTWILASTETREQAGDDFVWRHTDRTAVAGRTEGTDVHELLGVEGSVEAAILSARDAYEEALAAYLDRRFEDAAKGFGEARRLRPDDLAAVVLGDRAHVYIETPPPPDWTGVYVQTKK